ncbi:MAG: hypothetical protein IJV02_05685, partial [Candidatus Methanomethylophilaceae archaeon]|nr:hypothetical protein [Candidatus Methanomethylophilaceae archaeon]
PEAMADVLTRLHRHHPGNLRVLSLSASASIILIPVYNVPNTGYIPQVFSQCLLKRKGVKERCF